jgi:hypothetical protein
MALTYTKTVHKTERIEKTLVAYKEWGMYTAAGNARLRKNAEKLLSVLEDDDSDSKKERIAFRSYFKAYKRAKESNADNMSEAGDTAVRECVWDFAVKAGGAIGLDHNTLDVMWDEET